MHYHARVVCFSLCDKNSSLLDNVNLNGASLLIQLHNYDKKWHPKVGDCVINHYKDHFDNNRWRQAYTMTYEKVATMAFSANFAVNCSGIGIESHLVSGLTSNSAYVTYYWNYNYTGTTYPGVFAMANAFQGGDAVSVRAFNRSQIGFSVTLQEDQCDKESVLHINPNRVSVLVIGQLGDQPAQRSPGANLQGLGFALPNVGNICLPPPTFSPTKYPTVKPTTKPSTIPTVIPYNTPSIGYILNQFHFRLFAHKYSIFYS